MRNKTFTTEAEILSAVKKRLAVYQMTRVVEFWTRIQCGQIFHNGHWIHLSEKGTPDLLAVIRNKISGLTLLFIEVKKPGCNIIKGSPQDKFFAKYFSVKDIICIMVDDPRILDFYINKLGIDRLKELPESVG